MHIFNIYVYVNSVFLYVIWKLFWVKCIKYDTKILFYNSTVSYALEINCKMYLCMSNIYCMKKNTQSTRISY